MNRPLAISLINYHMKMLLPEKDICENMIECKLKSTCRNTEKRSEKESRAMGGKRNSAMWLLVSVNTETLNAHIKVTSKSTNL